MKLRVKADGHNIRLWVPNSMLKSRFVYSIVKSAVTRQIDKKTKEAQPESGEQLVSLPRNDAQLEQEIGSVTMQVEDTALQTSQDKRSVMEKKPAKQTKSFEMPITHKQIVELYKALNKCIKDNGHFNLLEVDAHDGTKVVIRL